MIKKMISAVAFIGLSGCTSLADFEKACESETAAFGAFVSCLNTRVDAENFKLDSFESEYLLTAQELNDRVDQGKITETKARVELKRLYNEILINRARLQALQASRVPRQVDCRILGDQNITCRSF